MKKIKYIAFFILASLALSGCSGFLDEKPQGMLDDETVSDPAQIEGLVTSAYAALASDKFTVPFSLWSYGNVRGGDAYKGGRDEADVSVFHYYEISQNIKTDFGEVDEMWFYCYEGISRANLALKSLHKVSESEYADKQVRIGEMYFLRGYFHFMLKILFKKMAYIDENVPTDLYKTVTNNLDNDELWGKVANDFKMAYDNLPTSKKDVGRADKYAAAAFLAKVYLYKAYRQNDMNDVISIDKTDLEQVLTYTDIVMNSSYGLEFDFAYNFLHGSYENGKESVFAVQFSIDDGLVNGRLNYADELSVPMGLGCCDFHKPSQNLVNSFRTSNGLPMFSTFDNNNYNSASDKADPRLFHTVALPGFPYKYNTAYIYDNDWNRNKNTYGLYASLKENVDPDCPCMKKVGDFYPNSKNRIVMRYADVLLFRAEALIELNRQAEALPLINQIRARAQKSTGLINYAPNLNVSQYEDGVNCTWTQAYAREALQWERRLEFAMEGSHFFDLVRWGTASTFINSYYKTEGVRRSYLAQGYFTKNKNEYMPIPQNQMNYAPGLYTQNYGW